MKAKALILMVLTVALLGLIVVVISRAGVEVEMDTNGSPDIGSQGEGGFSWRREGGVVGFCDIIEVSAVGKAAILSCASEPPQQLATLALTESEIAQLQEWSGHYASFTYEETDPALADSLRVVIIFQGVGSAQPDPAAYSAINAMATTLLRRAGAAP